MRVTLQCSLQASDYRERLQTQFGDLAPPPLPAAEAYQLCEGFLSCTLQLPADQQVLLVPRGDVVMITGFVLETNGPADVWLGDPAATGPHLQLRPASGPRGVARLAATATVPQLALRAAVAGQLVEATCSVWGGRPGG